MTMDVALSPYDANIREALIWWRNRCTFMRATAALKGYNPDKVVPLNKWVQAVKTSATPGLVEAKFKNPPGNKKAYRFEVIATYSQLKSLMGQASLDRFLLGGESERWDLPKRKESDLEREKKQKRSDKESGQESEKQGGLQDDSIPESAEQILPDENVEEEDEDIEEDETSKSAKEAEQMLEMDTSSSNE